MKLAIVLRAEAEAAVGAGAELLSEVLTESAMKRAFHADDDSHEAQIAKATAQIAKARKVDTLVNMMSTDGLLDVEQRKKANTLLDGFLETFDT